MCPKRSLWYKFIALAIALVLIVPILAACGGKGKANPTSTPTTPTLTATPTPTSTATPGPHTGSVVVKQSGGENMLPEECGDKQNLINGADYIVEGVVERVESKWNEDKSLIFTYTDLLIEKYVKGAPFAENKLQVVTLGGEVGDIGLGVEDQPIFHEGKRVRLYFQERDGEFGIICAHFGVEELER